MYQLFYYPRNASWAPHMLLKELGVDFELVLIDRKSEEQKSQKYLELNPTGRIPTLIDGDAVIFESAAICMHLCDSHPEGELVPKVNIERTEFFQWLFYLVTAIQPEMMLYFYPEKHVAQGACAKSIVRSQEQRVTEMFSLIDSRLANSSYLAGSKITVCDFFLFMLSHWASGFTVAPLSFKHLGAHLRKLTNRPSIIAACETEGTSLEAYR